MKIQEPLCYPVPGPRSVRTIEKARSGRQALAGKDQYKRRKIKLATRRFKMSFQKSWHSPHNQLTLAVAEDCSFSPPLLHPYSTGDKHWTF